MRLRQGRDTDGRHQFIEVQSEIGASILDVLLVVL